MLIYLNIVFLQSIDYVLFAQLADNEDDSKHRRLNLYVMRTFNGCDWRLLHSFEIPSHFKW